MPPICKGHHPTYGCGCGKKAISQSDCSHILTTVTAVSNAKAMLGYNTVIWRTWVMVAGSNFAFKIAAKPLQIETYGYYFQPIGTRHHHIQRYHC